MTTTDENGKSTAVYFTPLERVVLAAFGGAVIAGLGFIGNEVVRVRDAVLVLSTNSVTLRSISDDHETRIRTLEAKR